MRWRLLLGAALALAGAGALIAASGARDSDAEAEVVGGNLPVNAGAGDRRDITSHNSPSLVQSPVDRNDLVVANRIDTPLYSCALHRSSDGGASWRQVPIPAPRGEEPKCYAPDAAFGPDGTLYLVFVTLKGRGNVPNAVWTSRMAPGARRLSRPRKALGPLAFQVRLVADRAKDGRLYLTWLQGSEVALLRFPEAGNPIRAIRSENGGRSWARSARVSDPKRRRVVGPSTEIGPRGELYVLYLDVGRDRLDYDGAHRGRGGPPFDGRWSLVLARSRDRGRSWDESVVDDGLVPSERFVVFIPPFPALAVDRRSGRLHAAFQDAGLGDADVRVWTLRPGATRWSGGVRVNDTPRADRTAQYRPQLAVAPNGRLDVVYYDRRADPPRAGRGSRRAGRTRGNLENEVSLQSSFDGGRSFTASTRISETAFDSRIGFGSERGLPDLGSRLALLSTNAAAFAVWPDTRAGTIASGKQDLSRALVTVTEDEEELSEPVTNALRYGGAAAAALGLGLVVLGALAGRRARRERREGEPVEEEDEAPVAS